MCTSHSLDRGDKQFNIFYLIDSNHRLGLRFTGHPPSSRLQAMNLTADQLARRRYHGFGKAVR
jgi:hypothetical protein